MSSSHFILFQCPLCNQMIPSNQDFMNHFQSHPMELQQHWYKMRLLNDESQVFGVPLNHHYPMSNNNVGQCVQANRDEHDEQSTRRNDGQVSNLTITQNSSVVTRPLIDQLDVPIQRELNVDDENDKLNLTLSL